MDEGRDLGAWLYRTTSDVCYDILRRTKQALAIDGIAEREVLVLRDLEGNSTADVARILRIAEGTVRLSFPRGGLRSKTLCWPGSEDQVNRCVSETELALCAGGNLENSGFGSYQRMRGLPEGFGGVSIDRAVFCGLVFRSGGRGASCGSFWCE